MEDTQQFLTQYFEDDPDISRFMENTLGIQSKQKVDLCSFCNQTMILVKNQYCCKSCGFTKNSEDVTNVMSSGYVKSHNINKQLAVNVKFSGSAHANQLNVAYRSICATHVRDEKKNYESQVAKMMQIDKYSDIPLSIIRETVANYIEIRNLHCKVRSAKKFGVFLACLIYCCSKANVMILPNSMTDRTGIQPHHLTTGLRHLRDMINKNDYKLFDPKLVYKNYAHIYLRILNINARYANFVNDVIECANEGHITGVKTCEEKTKSVGVIWMLLVRMRKTHIITKSKLEQTCSITSATFLHYYNVLMQNYKFILIPFLEHAIPMPSEWKPTVVKMLRVRKEAYQWIT